MHTVFFGGMAQYYYNAGGTLIQDDNVPFVSTIGLVTRDANAVMTEIKIGDMQVLSGSGSEFLINKSLPLYEHDVIKYSRINQDSILAGYLVGGINSSAPNIFNINNGTQSFADPTVYKVILVKNSVVPLQLLSFKGLRQSGYIALQWKTAWEQDMTGFEIEHSSDAVNFTSIGYETAKGSLTQFYTYDFRHYTTQRGLNYYRLKMIGLDGTFSYSMVVVVMYDDKEALFLAYPNPVKEHLIVEWMQDFSDKVVIVISDMTGRRITNEYKPGSTRRVYIKTAALPAGTYVLQILAGDKNYNSTFIKE